MPWPDDFDLGPDAAVEPLPLPGAGMPQMPQPPQAKKPGWKEMAPLAAIIPLIAQRGGRVGIAAFLQGLQQAQAAKQGQARQGYQDERQAALDQQQAARYASEAQARQAQIANQEGARKQALLKQFGEAIEGLDDPEAVKALTALYGQQADAIGLGRGTLDAYAASVATPDKLQKKAAEKRIAKLRTEHGVKWMEEGAKFTHQLPGDPQPIPFEQLLKRAGMERDPAVQAPVSSAINPDVPLDRQHAAALVAGNMALVAQIEDAMKRQDSAKSQPVNPELASINQQIAQLRLDNLRAAKTPDGLPPRIQTQIAAKQRGWDSLPIVKTAQKMAEAVEFANSLDINTKNPADDQALIYAFAKAMDPDSVVREGEYATVQKYAQSWAQSFGFNAARIFSNTPFLTTQARANMKKTIRSKFAANRKQYDNVRRSYAQQINKLTKQGDGEDYLTDYAGGFPETTPAPTTTGTTGATYEEYQRAKGKK
jgi:hypothetical protein